MPQQILVDTCWLLLSRWCIIFTLSYLYLLELPYSMACSMASLIIILWNAFAQTMITRTL